jgi:hypothetical protein
LVVSAAIPKPKVFDPMHDDLYHHEKRIMKPKNFPSELSSTRELEKKSVCSMEKNSSVLQCKIDEPVVYQYICMPIEHEKLAAENGENSLLELPSDANRSKDKDAHDVVRGLSLMSPEAMCHGTIATSTVQRCNIFQPECKIQDKVCKLIIDGSNFTNTINSDLVYALSLSTWQLPTPRSMQWMNQSGKLKITHKVRVKFSVGNYVDIVDCDVAPLSACHLLLGRHDSLI